MLALNLGSDVVKKPLEKSHNPCQQDENTNHLTLEVLQYKTTSHEMNKLCNNMGGKLATPEVVLNLGCKASLIIRNIVQILCLRA